MDNLVQRVAATPDTDSVGRVLRQVRVTGLVAGTSYQFRIRALNADGDSTDFEASANAQDTVMVHPATPVNMFAEATATTIVLTWEQPFRPDLPKPDGYRVEQAFDPYGHWADCEYEVVPVADKRQIGSFGSNIVK